MRILPALPCLFLLLSCANDGTTGPGGGRPLDTAAVTLTLSLDAVSGGQSLHPGSRYQAPNGVEYEVTLLRYYLGFPVLVDTAGVETSLQLLDTSGNPLRYNLTLHDLDAPEPRAIRFKARPGMYRELRFIVGVPLFGPAGDTLNHSDASANEFPLNVDADMYWGWKAGYIHFKLEGRSRIDTADAPFYYHVGEDRRLMYIRLSGPLTISPASTAGMTIRLDVNRIFVTPGGTYSPNPGGGLSDRIANSGAIADTVANNISNSGVFTLVQ